MKRTDYFAPAAKRKELWAHASLQAQLHARQDRPKCKTDEADNGRRGQCARWSGVDIRIPGSERRRWSAATDGRGQRKRRDECWSERTIN